MNTNATLKPLITVTLALLLSLANTLSLAQERHEHGHADLELSLEGSVLVWDWHIPTEAIMGFEYTPITASERSTWAQAESDLRQASLWLHTNAEAQCKVSGIDLAMPPVAPDAAPHETSSEKKGHRGHDGHSDIDWEVRMRCQHPDALHTISASLFSRWPRLHRIHVQAATHHGQASGTLSAQTPSMRLP